MAQTGVGVCSTMVVTFVEQEIVLGLDRDTEQIGHAEEVFPGIGEITGVVVADFTTAGGTSATRFNYDITTFGPTIKSFCSAAIDD